MKMVGLAVLKGYQVMKRNWKKPKMKKKQKKMKRKKKMV
jgi:hypothetical protein